MQLNKYGIILDTLTSIDLELVRTWRNSDHVKENMKYRGYIDSTMQTKWFDELNQKNNFYFVIKEKEVKIGLINLKEIDWERGIAEAGIFIGEKEYLNSPSPLLATISIMEFAFEELNLKVLKAKIASANLRAILYNESIGYKKAEIQEDEFHYYHVNHRQFLEATKNIRATLNKLK